ncbi:hypothetical protein C7H85_15015 [Zobellella endophytica]|uniref:Uncharacterized protein n=2 Tax=Zobellella endophytica TaxID=2116700 RepID=A0A2P7R1I2_9GAMM|nr:hypothetical protein C7H85_15015 [Zobellella endophytica]
MAVMFRPLIMLLFPASLLLAAGWQLVQLTELGQRWQSLPQRHAAAPLADYAELQAVRALTTEDTETQQQLVDELAAAGLVLSARLYDGKGKLLAASGEVGQPASEPYVRELYLDDRPVGFLRLGLDEATLAAEQSRIWAQLRRHLGWLLPLCTLLGALLWFGLHRWQRRIAGRGEAGTPPPGEASG